MPTILPRRNSLKFQRRSSLEATKAACPEISPKVLFDLAFNGFCTCVLNYRGNKIVIRDLEMVVDRLKRIDEAPDKKFKALVFKQHAVFKEADDFTKKVPKDKHKAVIIEALNELKIALEYGFEKSFDFQKGKII
mmetsp:Transcript_5020/g.7255  ORF Transcript_5020/g.7255 Transcript_5020/m.7255 type:complete len:135 (+) Transcript_5020:137-541(+)